MPPKDSAPKATVKFKIVKRTVELRHVTIPPGGIVPPYHIGVGYVVFPLSPGVTTLRKTTYHGGRTKVETLTLPPDEPFYVPGFARGVKVSMENIGSNIAIFGKVPVDSGDWDWPPKGSKAKSKG